MLAAEADRHGHINVYDCRMWRLNLEIDRNIDYTVRVGDDGLIVKIAGGSRYPPQAWDLG